MKTEKIRAILVAQTCGLYPEHWYDETVKMIKPIRRDSEQFQNIFPRVMELLNQAPRNEKIFLKEFFINSNITGCHQRFVSQTAFDLCDDNGIKFKRGKTNGTRWFMLLS